MRRPTFVRLQLLILLVVAALVFGRMATGPGRPEGLVVFSDLEPHRLAHRTVALESPARFAVSATGSFAPSASGASPSGPLAAYAWIVRRGDREVVWQMTPQNVHAGRGALAQIQDTLQLAPGTYDVYFTTYGNAIEASRHRSFLRRITDADQHWRNDARKWVFALQPIGSDPLRVRHINHREEDRHAKEPTLVWTSGPVRNNKEVDHLLDVQQTVTLDAYAIGQFVGSGEDYAWIEDALTGERVWQMSKANTVPAGGASENRLFRGEVTLEPGVYRAVYKTDGLHAYDDWLANPPSDPLGWGLTLRRASPADTDHVQTFDPFSNRTALAAINRVPSNWHEAVQFQVNRPTTVFAYAVGEMVDSNPYDWAWIQDEDAGRRIWEMGDGSADHAGGAGKNRVQAAFIELEPGTYSLVYETDDSHAYDDWNDDPPQYPDRWGVTLFPVARVLPPDAVQILSHQREAKKKDTERDVDHEDHEMPEPPEPPQPWEAPSAPVLVVPSSDFQLDWTRLPNETQREIGLDLPEGGTFHIRAVGEITPRGPMDYGWIEDAKSGEPVWEMTWENTRPAGGDDRNRLFDGVIDLKPGRYVVHFETDMSHAFGDFREFGPQHAEAWGLTIKQVK